MMKFFTEAEEDITMNVQVGPQEEIDSEVKKDCCGGPCCGEDDCCCKNPVKEAKKNPDTVCVAATEKCGVKEFYVDAKDVATYADLNEKTMLESLNDIIECNESYGMTAANVVVVMSEGTEGYIRNLEKHGAACVKFVNEAEDIEMDVQVGPNEDEIKVSEDPQEANPVDAVKRQYDTVVVAKDGDDFFMDVEDVQKCADLNCESVIKTLNGIIAANEDFNMSAENIRVIINEDSNVTIETLEAMEEAGVFIEAGTTVADVTNLSQLTRKLISGCKQAAGKIKGDKKLTRSAIESEIESINKQIDRLQEEKENAYKPGFKPTAARITKVFIKCTIETIVALVMALGSVYVTYGAIGAAVAGKTGVVMVSKAVNRALPLIGKMYAIIGSIAAVSSSVKTLKDYEKSLDEWIKVLEDNRTKLEHKLEAMEEE